jgi:hypothetical protein
MTEQPQQTVNAPEVTPLVQSQPRPSASDDEKGPLASVIDALLSPLRWVYSKVTSGLESLRTRLRTLLKEGVGGFGGGFGFWWMATTILLAGFVGLLVAILVSPVMGVVAFLVVAIGSLLAGSDSEEDTDTATA